MNELKHDFEITEKLPKEFKDKWVKALRSGEYAQRKGCLHSNGRYCCLGVACIEAGFSTEELGDIGVIDSIIESRNEDIYNTIPEALIGDEKTNTIVNFLIKNNDNGHSFKDIANWIEKYL